MNPRVLTPAAEVPWAVGTPFRMRPGLSRLAVAGEAALAQPLFVRDAQAGAFAMAVRHALRSQGITGSSGAEIDHIELMGPAQTHGNSGRNFVLCPGGAYDRSPCGTGTSAKGWISDAIRFWKQFGDY